MKNLLNKQEDRWFRFVETLSNSRDWIILAQLATILDCSTRSLKNDIRDLNKTFDEFEIQTSIKGVKIEYCPNHDFKSFCQTLLANSENYQLLEMIFLNPDYTVQDLSSKFNMSLSTLYRTITKLNERLQDCYGFYIDTNPCRLIGPEENIRQYFYTYYFEKYHQSGWPFEQISEDEADILIKNFIKRKELPTDLMNFSTIKTIVIVNYIRYSQQQYLEVDVDSLQIQKLMPESDSDKKLYNFLEETWDISFSKDFILQVSATLIQKGILYTFDHFIQDTEQSELLFSQANLLRELLRNIAVKYEIACENLDAIVYALFHTTFFGCEDSHSEYILYDHHTYFSKAIKEEFPDFHQDLYDGLKLFRAVVDKPMSDTGINLYIYTVFSWWKDLVLNLRKNGEKIRVLVVSDFNKTHAEMLKSFIVFEFNKKLEVDVSDELEFETRVTENNVYDLVISTFKITDTEDINHVWIPNVPKDEDFLKIHKMINEINNEKLLNK